MDIEITNTQDHLPIDAAKLADLARRVLRGEGIAAASVSVAVVDDAAIRVLNRRHLDHDWPTDVMTFPLSEPGAPRPEAELVISAEMAAATAREAGSDPQAELALYLVHGLLHLRGWDDQTEADASAMRRREDEVLGREGIANPFARVAPTGQGGASCRA